MTSAVIAGRLGDPHRFTSLSAIRSYSGLVPKVNQSGLGETKPGITKAGDPLLRETLFNAADHARKIDPQLAAKYARLMSGDRHRDSALCHIATQLLTRIAACWRDRVPYQLRDVDGRPVTEAEGRAIITDRYKVDHKKRDQAAHRRMRTRQRGRSDGPEVTEVAKRPNIPARQDHDTQRRRGLTFLRNSVGGHNPCRHSEPVEDLRLLETLLHGF